MSANTSVQDVEKKYLDEKYNTLVHSHTTVTDERKGEQDLLKSQFTIPDDFLPTLNAYVNDERNIIVHLSINIEE